MQSFGKGSSKAVLDRLKTCSFWVYKGRVFKGRRRRIIYGGACLLADPEGLYKSCGPFGAVPHICGKCFVKVRFMAYHKDTAFIFVKGVF